ncbi:MAG: ATP-grasp domain-containing protein [Methyloceanibacter sp.]
MPKNSRPSRPSVLIAAISGRALARAAVEAGLVPLVADFFADADTEQLAYRCCKFDGDIGRGMQWPSLATALASLAEAAPPPLFGAIYGSGFEDRPELLMRVAERWPLLGNDAAAIARVKAPESFFATLDALGIPHPQTANSRPRKGANWLAKRRGGAGGSHVVPSRLQKDSADVYYQELVEGRSVSALFVANGEDTRVLAFSEQWTSPAPGRAWRYGGAAFPAALAPSVEMSMTDAVERAASAFGLKGLGSADFILRDDAALPIEINPRPGATLDLFASDKTPLLTLHLNAVIDGRLPVCGREGADAAASAIVYAPKAVIMPQAMAWPDWTADRPKPAERIDKLRPICTVLARAGTIRQARCLVDRRIAQVLAKMQRLSRGKRCEREEQDQDATSGIAERQQLGRAVGARTDR